MDFRRQAICGTWLAVMLLVCAASPAEADDWIFRRSYYSHADSPGYRLGVAPQPRSAYRRPYWPTRPHGFVRSGYRINNVRIYNGSNYDTEYRREYWYDVE